MYAEVNLLFGDIVKVTPSSKVVGDMCMFMISRGVKPGDASSYLQSLPAGTSFPESVIDMLQGGLGQPMGGWPADVQKIILGKRKPFTNRPGERAEKVDLNKTRTALAEKMGVTATALSDDDLYSHLMYPQVFADFVKFRKTYSDISVLPTPAYFYGLKDKEEISINLEEGKTLFAKLLNLTEPDSNGQRTAIFELNGYPRHVQVTDKSVTTEVVARVKADPADILQIGAPMPGMVASITVSVGHKVKEGDPLLTLEAMKMFTTVTAPCAGTVQEIAVTLGGTVESKDLMVRLAK
jgi:pyruvate carboxylase